VIEASFISFFLVLLVAVFFSAVFARLHLPWAVGLIFAGILIGPSVTGIFTPNETISFMGQIGLVFLVFMAGLEVRFSSLKTQIKSVSLVAFVNGSIPFLVGLSIGFTLGLPITDSLLLGIIFISSSVAVVVPSLKSNKLLDTKLGNTILGSTMLQDITSLLLLSLLFQSQAPATSLPLPLFYILLISFLFFLRKVIPYIENYFAKHGAFQQEFRSVMVVLIGTVVVFELLGLHSIIAGFFAGLVLSDRLRSGVLKEKLSAISYGLFIPIFFIVVGAGTNLSVFVSAKAALLLVSVIVLGSMLSKLISGYIGGRMAGYTNYESTLIGTTSISQLSTTLAAAFSGYALGLITIEVLNALVILSIITSVLAPMISQAVVTKKTPID